MTFLHGRNTKVWFNAYDVGPYLSSIGFSGSRDTADVTNFASGGNKEAIAGTRSSTISAGGFHDADLTELDTTMDSGSGVLTWSPGAGSAIGDRTYLASIIGTSLQRSSPVGDVVAIAWDTMADTVTGLGWILHPKGEDTNTTTGASKDDGAATSTGWQAHLHVFAVDGGSWVVKLQDSANNSAWTDVTGGAFAAVTGAASERLVSAASTTDLRRYLRYLATRTGGTAGDGITFALGYARNR